VAPQPQPGAEALDEGARKLRVMPMLEARYNLLGLTCAPNPDPNPNPNAMPMLEARYNLLGLTCAPNPDPNANPNAMPMLEARYKPRPHPSLGPDPSLHLALNLTLGTT
jgi:hypothetical protein